MTDPVLPPAARPHYFTGESLLTGDFQCEQDFQMGSLAAVNASLHTYGIASGLEVEWHRDTQPNQVHVAAGMAIDRLGRQIVLSQPQLVTLGGIEAGATYYLTIRHHEAYDDLTDESGVLGYKRVVQQPQITYERTLRDAGLNILLAVLTFTNQGAIDSLAYRAGRDERRYVGGRFGDLTLVTEGAGIAALGGGAAQATTPSLRLAARRETDGSGLDFLEVEAARCQFDGQLTTRGNLGIGIDHPTANLQIRTPTTKGGGTFTTMGDLLTLTEPVVPALQPGDLFVPDVSAALPAPRPAQVAIASALAGGLQYKLAQAFDTDFTTPTRFTFVRTTLARFTDPKAGDLLSVRNDGTLWLGTLAPASPGSDVVGPGVLSITASRRVGIGLSGGATPQAGLQVAGGILADQLVADQVVSNGVVKAQAFEGNGSKLTNLSFLSYWTKANVSASSSPIYYNQGNVGVQMTNPPGALSAGTRPAFMGSGLISRDPNKDPLKVTGNLTLFTTEIRPGDSITVGKLDAQRRQIVKIVSDTELQLSTQFTLVIQKAAYNTVAADPNAEPQAGAGTISSCGTTILGTGTAFTKLKEGSYLETQDFAAVPSLIATWMVDKVVSDTELTLHQPKDPAELTLDANQSAFMVSPGLLMGYFQSNEGKPLDQVTTVPAMLIKSNGSNADPTLSPNTVAINIGLFDTDPRYALQVAGQVNFDGHTDFTDLTAQTLTVTKSLTVSGDGTADTLVSIGEKGATALLSVSKTAVNLGAPAKTTGLLNVGGDITASGALGVATVNATAINSGTVTTTGLFTGQSLSVQGVAINGDGSVQLFANRKSYGSNDLYKGSFTDTATSDGFVVVFVGTVDPTLKTTFASMVSVDVKAGSQVVSSMVAAASTNSYTYSEGKKGSVTLQIPTFGTLTVPVRKGETWILSKTDAPPDAKIPGATLVFYWVPLGPGAITRSDAPPPGPQPHEELLQSVAALRNNIATGASVGTVDGAALAATQRIIDGRVGDLTQILGDATEMDADPQARADFIRDLQTIVCRAQPPGEPPAGGLDDANVQALIDTFGRLTEHTFTPEQRTLLGAGVRALVEINASEQNRHDLDLIKSNIGLFLDNMEAVLGKQFDTRQRRLLTRALVRLVGDGSQNLSATGTPVADDGAPHAAE